MNLKPTPRLSLIGIVILLLAGLVFWFAYTARGGDNPFAVFVQKSLATKTPAPTATRGPAPTPLYPILVNSLGRENESYRLDLGVDGSDNIYVGNAQTGQVQVFNSSGASLAEWSIEVEDAHGGVETVDNQGHVYTIVNGNLYQYDGLTGQRLRQIEYERGSGFRAVAVTPSGGLAAIWNRNWQDEKPSLNDLVLFDPEYKVDDVIEEIWPSPLIVADGSGNLYTDRNWSVYKYTPAGELVHEFEKVLPGNFTVDTEGRLFVAGLDIISRAEPNGYQVAWTLTVYSPDGPILYRRSLGTNRPTDLVFNAQSELILVGEFKSTNRVSQFVPPP